MVTPADWREVRLSEVCEANWGNTSITKASYIDSGVTAFSASGPDGYVSWHERSGDGIVLSAIGNCGKTWLARGEWTPIKNTIWIQPRVPDCNVRYLYHATGRPDVWPSRGAAQPFISLGDVRDVLVKLPPLKEQEAIAEALGDADYAVEALDALIAKKRNVKQAVMQRLCTGRARLPGFMEAWTQVSVGHAVLRSFSGPSPTCEERNIEGDEWGVLKTTCATKEFGWDWTKHKVLPRAFWGISRCTVQVGDTIITKAGPRHRVGVPAFVNSAPPNILVSGKMIGLRPDPSVVHPPFLALALNDRRTQEYLDQRTTGMAESQVNFENSALLSAPIWLPSLKEQEAIATVLSDVDAEIEALVTQREKLRLLKQGMMQELLSGRVRLV